MTRRKMMFVGIGLLLGTGVCLVTAMLVNLAVGVNDSGSTELAEEWRETLQSLAPSAGDLRMEPPGIEVVRFPNGEWVIGFAQNSHGRFVHGGGTLVVKDNRGNVRAFFGHVCGPRFLRTFFRETRDLTGFYACVERLGFTEHGFP